MGRNTDIAKVCIAARTSADLDRVVGEINAAGGTGEACQTNMRDHGSVEAAVFRAVDFCDGALDIVVNNAGIFDMTGFDETDLETWERLVAVNLTGPILTSMEALAALRAETEAANAALTERVDAAEAKLAAQAEEAATARSDLAASLEGRIAAAEAAKADTSAISAAVDVVAGRVTQAEATLAGIRKEVDGLSGLGGEYNAPSAETLERVAAFGGPGRLPPTARFNNKWKSALNGAGYGPLADHHRVRRPYNVSSTYHRISFGSHSMAKVWNAQTPMNLL